MNNILRDEIELTDAELAGVYGAAGYGDDGDEDEAPDGYASPAPAKYEAPAPVAAPAPAPSVDSSDSAGDSCYKEKRPCVDIFIICERKHK